MVKSCNSGIFDIRIFTDNSLYLAQFHAEAANLYLSVATPDEFDIAILLVADYVARTIERLIVTTIEGILNEHLCRFLWAVQIAVAHMWTGNP